jgi:hypothetical protein
MANYSNFLYDPFAPDTVHKLEQYEEFQFKCPDKEKAVRYIIIMYDLASDLKKLYEGLYERKRNAAILAGFTINGGLFDPWVEAILVGENDHANDAILRYVRLSGIPDASAYLAYTEILHKQVLAAMKETDEKKIKVIQDNIENAMEKVRTFERRIFSGDEVENVRAALYRYAEKIRLNLRPEDKASEIDRFELNVNDPYYKEDKKRWRPKK